ncbi:DUF1330 domain-containing protein [Erythrobacter tepidarius]|uniref:DUF1330 domain-containing protein n=1 Tax=Erythrobacter tepidarius TaxID=60454 RepID=UPI001302835E|nr:DUF1330 domain-containing protein [Erythrobacter tepidarius]
MIFTLVTALLAEAATPAAIAPPPQSTCDSPVYMVVQGRTRDRERMIRYGEAIAASRLYQELGGYYITLPRPIAVFEGEVPPDYVNLTVRFPCIENARAFWNSRTYREDILPLRTVPDSAGDYTVAVFAEAPLREDMIGRVGDNRYLADFPADGIAQVGTPVPDAPTVGAER